MTSRRTPSRGLVALVLAGGRSTRFKSDTPKVLHPVLGRTLLGHVLETLKELHRSAKLKAVCVVVPPGGRVEEDLEGAKYPYPLTYAVQRRPLGTGDAVRAGLGRLSEPDEVLVLAGDAPLVQAKSLRQLVKVRRSRDAAAAMLTAVVDDPGAYGRVLRNGDVVTGIVEAKDATSEQRRIREINASTYVFTRDALQSTLPKLRKENRAGEYYLTDAVGLLVDADRTVVGVEGDTDEVLGANTRGDYAIVGSILRKRVLDRLLEGGVTIVDPQTTYVDAGVDVGPDTVLHPLTFLEGETKVGRGCEIGPSVRLVDSRVEDGAKVTFAVVHGTRVGPEAEVGPFASLRPGTVLKRKAKAGTFVETKAAAIGEGSKVPHLSYMGDVVIGRDVNVGAGTITCNYNPFELAPDGSTKHRTRIRDGAYVSSDTMLVAPVTIGTGSQTGAGSVVTSDVPDGTLAYGVPAKVRGEAKQKPSKKAGSPKAKGGSSKKGRSRASARSSKKKGKGRGASRRTGGSKKGG